MNKLTMSAVIAALILTMSLSVSRAQSSFPAQPITAEQAREIYDLTAVPALMRAMAHQALTLQKAYAPEYIPEAVWQDLESSLNKIDMSQALTAAYQKSLSEEDGVRIIAFYKTPEGRRLIAATPAILQSMGEIARREGAKVGMQVFARHTDEIFEAKKKFDTEQKHEQEDISKPPAAGSKPH